MNDPLANIRSQIGAENLSSSCSRDRCQVSMENVPSPRIIADADKAFPAHGLQGKKCDYVLFFVHNTGQQFVAAPIELKSGHVDASAVASQLQQGANFAKKFTPKGTDCHPILIHGKKRIHSQERKTLNRAKVQFYGKSLTIKTARCGRSKNLAGALESK